VRGNEDDRGHCPARGFAGYNSTRPKRGAIVDTVVVFAAGIDEAIFEILLVMVAVIVLCAAFAQRGYVFALAILVAARIGTGEGGGQYGGHEEYANQPEAVFDLV
jgi:hypothetical protein